MISEENLSKEIQRFDDVILNDLTKIMIDEDNQGMEFVKQVYKAIKL